MAAPTLAQQTAPSYPGQTQGMRYLSWGGKAERAPTPTGPVISAAPAQETSPQQAAPLPTPQDVASAYPEPLRSAFSDGRQQIERPVRERPIVPRRPIMTLNPAPQPIPVDPALARLAMTPAPSRGLTPASAWLTPPASTGGFAARLPAPRPYVSTPYVPASTPAPAYAERVEMSPPPMASTTAEAVPPYIPPVDAAPVYDTPAYEASAYDAPPYAAPPPAPTPETMEAPVMEAEARAIEAPTAYAPYEAPVVEAVSPPPVDAPAPAVVDPMAPRADAPIFRMQPRDDAPPPLPTPPAPDATSEAPAAPDAAFDPMAPRADAPVFRLQRPAPAGMAQATEPVPEQQGARYYSVHRQNGQRPDATVLPEGVFLDSLPVDLAEPPPPPTVVRDRNGQNRVIVPNEDPSLP